MGKPETGLAGDAALAMRAALVLAASREVAVVSAPVFGAASEAALV